ncbi:hypothetical protein GCM10007216_39350 [Thalassobacillus devorans]|uniref:Uncharacterized protein n=1 Tax=Thalassobacillus devorans TaxID=279813 RepID=A0ABQ1PV54_9BACI|nr:hypothetical protein GCM10007216_39350 [Thalassobacillus devorans]
MIRLLDGTYVAFVNGRCFRLHYLNQNRCQIYINNQYKGIGPFDYIKEQITMLERFHPFTRLEYMEDTLIFQELKNQSIRFDMKV